MKKILIGFCTFLVLQSCFNDSIQNVLDDNSNVERLTDPSTYLDYDRLFTSQKLMTTRRMTRGTGIEAEETLITIHGITQMKSIARKKIALNSENAKRLKLKPGIYVVEYLECIKDLKIGNNIFSPEDSPKCGYIPGQDFSLGNGAISISKKRGYSEKDGGSGILSTVILHVVSDIAGRKINRYDPCSPSQIEWNYLLIQL
jgi:hypothetical protein